ncbi:MAG TPA: cobalt ECF transporter T component CbiQ [Syntrophorhabdaceae bacterium]|nr:cobalt ECF transporter T component CbiQ [Syntrophorhabdaceae bacterium]
MRSQIPEFLLKRSNDSYGSPCTKGRTRGSRFFDRSLDHFAAFIKSTCIHWDGAQRQGLMQQLDPRVKLMFLFVFMAIISAKKTVMPEAAIGLFILILAGLSRLNLAAFYSKVLFLGFFFGFLVVLPSCLNLVSGGSVAWPLIHLSRQYEIWIYRIPQTIGITRQGLEGVLLITVRVINSLSLSFLIIHTTPFSEIIKALKALRVPDLFLMIITLSYKYIFVFAETVEDFHLARKSKVVEADASETRDWIAQRLAFLFRKTRAHCEKIYEAMLARGFSGDMVFGELHNMKSADIVAGAFMLVAGMCLILT